MKWNKCDIPNAGDILIDIESSVSIDLNNDYKVFTSFNSMIQERGIYTLIGNGVAITLWNTMM